MTDVTVIDTYEWNSAFRERILALLIDESFFIRYGNAVIRPDFFETDEERTLCREILDFYETYDRSPDEDELLAVRQWSGTEQVLMNSIYDLADTPLDFTEDQVVQFGREQAMKLAIMNSIDDIEDKRLSRPLARMEEALMVGVDNSTNAIYFDDVDAWLTNELIGNRIPTGLFHLDQFLEGGLATGEVGVITGPTGTGKTMALVNIGYGIVSPISKKNLLHITLEVSRSVVAKRYAARTTAQWFKRGNSIEEYKERIVEGMKGSMIGKLMIAEFPSRSLSIPELRSFLKKTKADGFDFECVVLDHLSEMNLEGNGERRHRLADTARSLRQISHTDNFGVPLWTAMQSTRSSINAEFVGKGDVAESFEVAQVVDIVIGYSQTLVEKRAGLIRLVGDKVRDGGDGWITFAKIDKDSHSLITLDQHEYKTKLDSSRTSADETAALSDYLQNVSVPSRS